MQARAAFPKAARLLKTDEFSSVFRLRPWSRTEHFVVYGRPTGGQARLGGTLNMGPAADKADAAVLRRRVWPTILFKCGALIGCHRKGLLFHTH